MSLPPAFSAAQIAAALGLSKSGVVKGLARIAPASEIVQRGGKTAVWRASQLPEAWQDSLAALAQQRGYRDSTHLLSDPGAPWQPQINGTTVQLSDLAEHCITDAQRLQRAILPSLERLTGKVPAPAAEAEAKGLKEYQTVFGHLISARHWQRLVNRTVDRAGAAQDFSRLELFLAAQLTRRTETAPGYVAAGLHLQSLRRALSLVNRPSQPTAEELVYIWTQAFDELAWLVEEGTAQKTAEGATFAALSGSGVRLALTPDALKKAFKRKLEKWESGGRKPSALSDGRRSEREEQRVELPPEDREVLIASAVECGGRVSQGFRAARDAGKLTPETDARLLSTYARKSHVPASIRSEITHDVRMLRDLHHGPRQARLKGPRRTRDWSDTPAGSWFQADDCTNPVYYTEETPEGVKVMRGQFIPMIDIKTDFILGFLLHSGRNYNFRIIRRLIHTVHDVYGLPSKGFYFENGIWKAHVLKGSNQAEIGFQETEIGLREFVEFRHAKEPCAKVVENTLGRLQNEMETWPGYIGRQEMVEKFERVQKNCSGQPPAR